MQAIDYAQQANGSFALPDACFKVKSLIDDDSSTVADFANVISIDPAMTSRLLKIANSAIYRFPGQISTISRAISIIGTEAIYQMMLIDVAAAAFEHFANPAIDIKRFWRTSVVCALASKNLSIQAGIKDIERLFVAGLLQNFGELLVATISPDQAKQAEQFTAKQLPWQLQQQLFGFTYTDVSAQVLKVWQLPEKIILPIQHFNQAGDIQINKDVKILNLASRLALIDSFPEVYQFEQLVDAKVFRQLDITEGEVIQALEIAQDEAQEILTLMNAKMFG